MDHAVAHAGHRTPRDLGIASAQGLENVLGRFADDFEAADEGPLQGWIAQKDPLSKVAAAPSR
jgi:hypothetical protein